jgi:hypothetical protein
VRTYLISARQTLGADRLPDATRTGYLERPPEAQVQQRSSARIDPPTTRYSFVSAPAVAPNVRALKARTKRSSASSRQIV